ncbi:uncharacterized protein LOC115996975 [Ipomoea triloba]|uniref:uncharacterized protein LOC115996975 n=1 Tax=Ipomoea triloba TaxID=35885 RepID=UPI00125DEB58|nr:uncharacterized protein LOC115996975 [Ipomoea triloba]
MGTLQDLIEEAKVRTVWWALCIFAVCYFITHTSKSMWMNVPIAVLLVSVLRLLLNEVEFHWKPQKVRPYTYLSHLEKKQLSVNDSRLSTSLPPLKWKRKIDAPLVEAAMEDFVNKLLHDYVIDLWYSDITPDKEAPELIYRVIMDALAEISQRVKEINLVDLLTRDIVDLIGDHLDLFRKSQAAIGRDVMATLSSEERDERLKHHLLVSKELHPALISAECEYKVLQRLISGVLAIVLRPKEAQCPLVRCIAREIVTCLVMQPILNFASPWYINELIEYIFAAIKDFIKDIATNVEGHDHDHAENVQSSDSSFTMTASDVSGNSMPNLIQDEHPRSAEWARALEAATLKRTEVLMPENLENMWTIGRNYKKKLKKYASIESQDPGEFVSLGDAKNIVKEIATQEDEIFPEKDDKSLEAEDAGAIISPESKTKFKRFNSTSDLNILLEMEDQLASKGEPTISQLNNADVGRNTEEHSNTSASEMMLHSDKHQIPKLKCRVIGAFFEKLGSQSFAVYSIAVTDIDNNTRFVKRRYRNFERLHRHLKEIPNYTLHLPPKRIFSSSTEDAFVHQRCILLDKYLQDLLSIANVAEQHEVWDFLSTSSKSYSFGKSPSVMKTLAVKVDDAVDDIVRQFKGVSDGLVRKVVSSPSAAYTPLAGKTFAWNDDEINKLSFKQNTSEPLSSLSDKDDGDKDGGSSPQTNEWHSDNEVNSKELPHQAIKHEPVSASGCPEANFAIVSGQQEGPLVAPPEWSPPNLSVPILNLVDNVFQLTKRGWLRRQVFWISKQILQLMMEDAIDDWLLRQIHWIRREEVIAQGIRWLQDILWPDGTFFLKATTQSEKNDGQSNQQQYGQPTRQFPMSQTSKGGSFEQQLEAARRASNVKNILFNSAPSALVRLIGQKQYRRCARDIYYFLQSTICLKQVAFAILELVLVSIFPELRDVVKDIHEQMRSQPA